MIHLQEFDIEKGLVSILTQKFLDMNTFFSGIIPDILDPVPQPDPTLMNHAFWRQNTRIHFTRSAQPLYMLDPVLQPDPTTFLCI